VKRVVGIIATMAVLAVGALGAEGATAGASAPQAQQVRKAGETGVAGVADLTAPRVEWESCPKDAESDSGTAGAKDKAAEPASPGVECASVRVPLDYRDPWGQSIKIALNRVKGSASRDHNHLGTMLVNPGGPGASGRDLAEYVAAVLPEKLAARYDIVGFDPRGVGRSEPAITCVEAERFYAPPRPDAVPRTQGDEAVLISRAREYAQRCGNLWAWFLPHVNTENAARDMDMIRAALGEPQISFLGYSYGTYLGAAYATFFPGQVKRLVLDSTVDPRGIWYRANLAQDRGFERRHRAFLAWTAEHNEVYRLGRTLKQTEFAWYSMRSRLRERPAGGQVGPSELDDLFTVGGYTDAVWPRLAQAWSRYVRKGEAKALTQAWKTHGEQDAEDENGYAVYLSVQCRDAVWPREWSVWRADMIRLHRMAPFMTWPNAWYNAPCAFWSVPGGTPPRIQGSDELPPILMMQAKDDAATPYAGSLNMRRLFPTARMVVVPGGNHGVSLAGNRCADRHLAAYLTDGSLPRSTVFCEASASPRTTARMAAERRGGGQSQERLTELISR
jgi:pimeloyl-ACP methyl ester carboxylesterase